MNDISSIRARYLRDGPSIRLGGLAANLARTGTCAANHANGSVVSGLIEESKWFIEWAAPDFITDEIETAAQLVQLQIQLARWQSNWLVRWADPAERARIAADANEWSARVMAMSGLLD